MRLRGARFERLSVEVLRCLLEVEIPGREVELPQRDPVVRPPDRAEVESASTLDQLQPFIESRPIGAGAGASGKRLHDHLTTATRFRPPAEVEGRLLEQGSCARSIA